MNKNNTEKGIEEKQNKNQKEVGKCQYRDAEKTVEQAYAQIKGGNHEKAEELLGVALEHCQEQTSARMALGYIKKSRGDIAGAMREYQECLKENGKNAIAAYNLGNIYRVTGNRSLAIRSYRLACVHNPTLVEAWSNLGLTLLETGKTNKAIEMLTKALELNPHHLAALNNLSKAYLSNGREEEAVGMLARADDIAPGIHEIVRNLAEACLQTKRFDESVKYFKRALRLEKDDINSLCGLAKAYRSSGDLQQAMKYCDQADMIEPGSSQVTYIKACIYEAMGEKERCRKLLEVATAAQTYHHAAEYKMAFYTDAKQDRAALDRALEQAGKADEGKKKACLNYIIAKYKEDMGDHDAINFYRLANKIERKTCQSIELNALETIKRNQAFRSTKSAWSNPESLVMIVGLPCSGGEIIASILRHAGISSMMSEKEYMLKADRYLLDSDINSITAEKRKTIERIFGNKQIEDINRWGSIFSFEYCEAANKLFQNMIVLECRMEPVDSMLAMLRTMSQVGKWGCSLNDINKYMRYYKKIMEYQREVMGSKIASIDMGRLREEPVKYWMELQQENKVLGKVLRNRRDQEYKNLVREEAATLRAWPYYGKLNLEESLREYAAQIDY